MVHNHLLNQIRLLIGDGVHVGHQIAVCQVVLIHVRQVRLADVNQGYLADCYLMVGMGAVANQRSDLI